MPVTDKRVRELQVGGALPDELLRASTPYIVRGLAGGWPLVRAGLQAPEAADAYLRRFYGDATVTAMLGKPEIGGRFFYNDAVDGFNFLSVRARLDGVLDELQVQRGMARPGAIYVGSTTIDTALPGLRAENDIDLGVAQRFCEARKARRIRRREVDQADGLAGRGEVDRADVQVGQLGLREQREAAVAGGDHGQVVRQVVMGGDAGAVADPDAGQRVASTEVDVVVLAQAGQGGVDRGRADVDGAGALHPALHLQLVQHAVQARPHRHVVEAGEVLVVEEAAADLGLAEHRVDAGVAVEAAQVGVGGVGRLASGLHQRPLRCQAAHDVGGGGAQQLVGDALADGQLAYFVIDCQHGRASRR